MNKQESLPSTLIRVKTKVKRKKKEEKKEKKKRETEKIHKVLVLPHLEDCVLCSPTYLKKDIVETAVEKLVTRTVRDQDLDFHVRRH